MKKHLATGRIVCYLLFLTVVCTLVFGASFSRFASQATGTGTANVAEVALNSQVDLSEKLKGMVPGDIRAIEIQVSNRKDGAVSEVTQSYTVSIETTGNLPLTYSLATKDTPTTGHALDQSGNPLVWTGGLLPHTEPTTHTYILTVSWPSGNAAPTLTNEIDFITITVDSKQES